MRFIPAAQFRDMVHYEAPGIAGVSL